MIKQIKIIKIKIIHKAKTKRLAMDTVNINNRKTNYNLRIEKDSWISKNKIIKKWIKLCNNVNKD